jgi:hypothetical protein
MMDLSCRPGGIAGAIYYSRRKARPKDTPISSAAQTVALGQNIQTGDRVIYLHNAKIFWLLTTTRQYSLAFAAIHLVAHAIHISSISGKAPEGQSEFLIEAMEGACNSIVNNA